MYLNFCGKAILLAIVTMLIFSFPAKAGSWDSEPDKKRSMNRIHIIIGDKRVSATLDDTPAGRDFARLLPLELSLRDYHATEKIAELPRSLDITDAPASYTPEAGDITYYAPWGNLAIFYKQFQSSRGLVRLGAFDEPIDALLNNGAVQIRIEEIEKIETEGENRD